MALPRHSLGPAASACAGPQGRYPVHQCGDGAGGARGNFPAVEYPRRSRCTRTHRRAPGWPLPIHQPRRGLAGVGLGCRTQSRRRAGAGAELKCQSHLGQNAGGVRDSGGQGRGGNRLHARAQHRLVVVRVSRRRPRPQRTGVGRCGPTRGANPGHRRRQRRERLCRGRKCCRAAGSNRGFRFLSYRGAGDGLARVQRIAAGGGASRIYSSVMDRRVKERLIGASILVALVVLVVPELLSGPKPNTAPSPTLPAAAPEPIRNVTVDLTTSKAPANSEVEPGSPETGASSSGEPSGASAGTSTGATSGATTGTTAGATSGASNAASAAYSPTAETPIAQSPAPAGTGASPSAHNGAPAKQPPRTAAARAASVESGATSPTSVGHGSWSVQLGSFASRAN